MGCTNLRIRATRRPLQTLGRLGHVAVFLNFYSTTWDSNRSGLSCSYTHGASREEIVLPRIVWAFMIRSMPAYQPYSDVVVTRTQLRPLTKSPASMLGSLGAMTPAAMLGQRTPHSAIDRLAFVALLGFMALFEFIAFMAFFDLIGIIAFAAFIAVDACSYSEAATFQAILA